MHPSLSHGVLSGIAAGVPYVLRRPRSPGPRTPLVVIWHLGDAPRTPEAMAAAVPLGSVDAWRAYLTLPMFGERSPEGGLEALTRRAMADAVHGFFAPVQSQAAAEFPEVLAALRKAHGIGEGAPLALVGGSMGGAVVMTVLTETDIPVSAASLLVPAVQLRPLVDGMGARFGIVYPWAEASLAAARRFDFVERARAGELRRRADTLRVQCLVGAEDAPFLRDPAEALRTAMMEGGFKAEPLEWRRIDGLEHALAEEPGVEAAPQTPAAKAVDGEVSRFLGRALSASA